MKKLLAGGFLIGFPVGAALIIWFWMKDTSAESVKGALGLFVLAIVVYAFGATVLNIESRSRGRPVWPNGENCPSAAPVRAPALPQRSEEERRRWNEAFEERIVSSLTRLGLKGDDLLTDAFRCARNGISERRIPQMLNRRYCESVPSTIDAAYRTAHALKAAVTSLSMTTNRDLASIHEALTHGFPGCTNSTYAECIRYAEYLRRYAQKDAIYPLAHLLSGTDATADSFRLGRHHVGNDQAGVILEFRYPALSQRDIDASRLRADELHGAISREGTTIYNDPEYSRALSERIRTAVPGCSEEAYGEAIDYLYFIHR
jgi:hypothetical protein